LKKDLQECSRMLKDYQEREVDTNRKDKSDADDEKDANK
jgi:hypothetical protein